MSTTFAVNVDSDEPVEVARRTSHGIIWVNRLAHLLPDDIEVIPLDNTAQGIHTIGDIKHDIKGRNKMKDKNGYPLRFNGDAKKILLDMGYFDDRPLTDETLKELGFELVPMYPDSENTTWSHPEHRFEVLQVDGKIESIRLLYHGGNFKTVGSVRILIEALKGDE